MVSIRGFLTGGCAESVGPWADQPPNDPVRLIAWKRLTIRQRLQQRPYSSFSALKKGGIVAKNESDKVALVGMVRPASGFQEAGSDDVDCFWLDVDSRLR